MKHVKHKDVPFNFKHVLKVEHVLSASLVTLNEANRFLNRFPEHFFHLWLLRQIESSTLTSHCRLKTKMLTCLRGLFPNLYKTLWTFSHSSFRKTGCLGEFRETSERFRKWPWLSKALHQPEGFIHWCDSGKLYCYITWSGQRYTLHFDPPPLCAWSWQPLLLVTSFFFCIYASV